jgi:hypothetical protein
MSQVLSRREKGGTIAGSPSRLIRLSRIRVISHKTGYLRMISRLKFKPKRILSRLNTNAVLVERPGSVGESFKDGKDRRVDSSCSLEKKNCIISGIEIIKI